MNENAQTSVATTAADSGESNEDLYMRAFREHSFGFLAILSPDGVVLESNTAALEAAGTRRVDVVGRLFWKAPWFGELPEAAKFARKSFEQVVSSGERLRAEAHYQAADGSLRTVDRVMTPIADDNGELRYVMVEARDITDRKRYEQALVEAKERAEEMARLKATLLANMSHEVRTPLTSILLRARILEAQLDGDQNDAACAIIRAGDRLSETLNSVLTLSQLEGGALQPRCETVELVDEIADFLPSVQPLAAEKDLELRFEPQVDSLSIPTDATLLGRILDNLVGNAIKFTDEGYVEVRLRDDGDCALIEVIDTGIGVDDEFLEDLFEEFRQESCGWSRAYEGTGLGLAITHKLCEMLGGSIGVTSQKGEGSVFSVRLPKQHAPLRTRH
ncbi:MAG: sensor histidine kinase [Persicimonas sp.]